MKKFYLLCLILVSFFSYLLVGCTEENKTPAEEGKNNGYGSSRNRGPNRTCGIEYCRHGHNG